MPRIPVIQSIERLLLNVPFTERCAIWNAPLVHKWSLIEVIRITTDAAGVVGFGEALPYYTYGRVSEEAIAQSIGRNPVELLGDDSLGASLQMALYDLVGKALEVPVHRLFNRPQVRSWCPLGWWNTEMPPEALREEAKEAVAQGYTAHKFKARPWIDVYAQVEAVSEATPPHYHLDLDWNDMLLNAGNATPVLQELDKYERISIYEGPIPQRDVEGYRQLRSKVAHPIAAHFGLPPFATAIREETCDGFVVFGGANEILSQGTLAGAFEKPFFLQIVGVGMTTAFMAHLGAVLPMAQWSAITCMNNYADDLIVEPHRVTGGYVPVPEGPGLGVAVDEEALERYRVEPDFELPRPRHIISVIWPGGRVARYAQMHDDGQRRDQVHFSHLYHSNYRYFRAGMQCWEDFLAGNHPVQERGVRFEVWNDDGSKEWADLYARVQQGPIYSAN